MRKRSVVLLLTLFSVTILSGSCVMLEDGDILQPLVALTSHERLIVSAPSWTGAALGAVAGLPLAILALPVTLPVAVTQGDMMLVPPFTPMLATAEIGAILLGGPVWLVAGWW